MKSEDKFKSVKKTYISVAISIIVIYTILMGFVYFADKNISVLSFLIIGTIILTFAFVCYILLFINTQKCYFHLQELLSRSKITNEELARLSNMPIEKIRLIRMDYYTFSSEDLKNLEKILNDQNYKQV